MYSQGSLEIKVLSAEGQDVGRVSLTAGEIEDELSSIQDVIRLKDAQVMKIPMDQELLNTSVPKGWEDWDFFFRWFLAVGNGKDIHDGVSRLVAEIPEEEWFKGIEHVSAEIRQIEDEYWSQNLPQHEVISFDEASGKYRVSAKVFDEDRAVESWLKQIEFALQLAAETNTSDFNRMCTGFKYLKHAVENCRDDPNAIEQHLGIARGIIEENINREGYLTDDSLIALSKVLEQIQVQMRADHPEVRKAWEKRIAQKIRETDRETKLEAAKAIRAETQRTTQRLSDEMELDAEAVETSDDEEVQAAALRRAGGRAAKMNALERASDTAKKIDASGGYKAVRIGSTGYTVGDIVWMLKDLFW